jgi:hypothetical protein
MTPVDQCGFLSCLIPLRRPMCLIWPLLRRRIRFRPVRASGQFPPAGCGLLLLTNLTFIDRTNSLHIKPPSSPCSRFQSLQCPVRGNASPCGGKHKLNDPRNYLANQRPSSGISAGCIHTVLGTASSVRHAQSACIYYGT